jgi:splicing factor U2AF 35 kDa subunit
MNRGRDQGPRGGAEHLARIHGTEEDKVNCPFYFKIGACRHGDKCSRQHHKPPFSQTIIVPHMWANPMVAVANAGGDLNALNQKEVLPCLMDFSYYVHTCGCNDDKIILNFVVIYFIYVLLYI